MLCFHSPSFRAISEAANATMLIMATPIRFNQGMQLFSDPARARPLKKIVAKRIAWILSFMDDLLRRVKRVFPYGKTPYGKLMIEIGFEANTGGDQFPEFAQAYLGFYGVDRTVFERIAQGLHVVAEFFDHVGVQFHDRA